MLLKEGRRLLAAAGRAWAATGFSHHHLKLGIQVGGLCRPRVRRL